ncbi:MAG TPA: hypothetical protein VLH08_14915, partial [Acidobacteriota bacterium]|nr:hypothetical protein [Acidobacteriota bacterium]
MRILTAMFVASLTLTYVHAQQQPASQENIPPAASLPGAPPPDDRYVFAADASTEVAIELTRTA